MRNRQFTDGAFGLVVFIYAVIVAVCYVMVYF
jgi:hypothetical protein